MKRLYGPKETAHELNELQDAKYKLEVKSAKSETLLDTHARRISAGMNSKFHSLRHRISETTILVSLR